jgi:hypothetical protein
VFCYTPLRAKRFSTISELSKRSCRQSRVLHAAGQVRPAHIMMDLQFINVSDPQQIKSGQARHLVRSQAMRSYRYRQREHVRTSREARATRQPQPRLNKAQQQYLSSGLSPRDPEDEETEEDVVSQQSHFSAIIRMTRGLDSGFFSRSASQAVLYRVLNYCT